MFFYLQKVPRKGMLPTIEVFFYMVLTQLCFHLLLLKHDFLLDKMTHLRLLQRAIMAFSIPQYSVENLCLIIVCMLFVTVQHRILQYLIMGFNSLPYDIIDIYVKNALGMHQHQAFWQVHTPIPGLQNRGGSLQSGKP